MSAATKQEKQARRLERRDARKAAKQGIPAEGAQAAKPRSGGDTEDKTPRVPLTLEEKRERTRARREARKTNECLCGCGKLVAGSFAQGHDQRVRGQLKRGECSETTMAAVHAGVLVAAISRPNDFVLTGVGATNDDGE